MVATSLLARFYEHTCTYCSPKARRPGRVYAFSLPPASAQSMKGAATTKYRNAIRGQIQSGQFQTAVSLAPKVAVAPAPFTPATSRLKTQPMNAPNPLRAEVPPSKVCVALIFCLALNQRNKDLDNMAKALLDAIGGPAGLVTDDMEIVHLECFKVCKNTTDFLIPTGIWPAGQPAPPAFSQHASFVCVRIQTATDTLVI